MRLSLLSIAFCLLVCCGLSPAPCLGNDQGIGKGVSKYQKVRTTAYTHTESDHVRYGRKNAIGTGLKLGKSYTSAASDWSRYPVGTRIRIREVPGVTFVIDDYGSALVGSNTIDLYHPTKRSMDRWGVRHVHIEILELGDFEKSREILAERTKWGHCRKMLASLPDEPIELLDPRQKTQPQNPSKNSPEPPDRNAEPEPEIRLAHLTPLASRDPSSPLPVIASRAEQPRKYRKRSFVPIPRRSVSG